MRQLVPAFAFILTLASAASGAKAVIEDWTAHALGGAGIPSGWSPYATLGGRPAYDFVITEDEGRRALRLASHDEHSTIAKDLHVDLAVTPILEWSWKIVEVPAGADIRQRSTSDLTGYLVVVWPRFPAALRSRVIAYAWGSREPAGSIEQSRKTSTVTFFILRSGSEYLGRWFTERRNVADDYREVYGEQPAESPKVIAISIDTNDTHSSAAALIGLIAFTSP
jgi:DUF3047 family protein